MFRLFQSIFSGRSSASGAYPEALIEQAIERAVDGTDPRLRALGGYRKWLREPVLRAAAHVIGIVDGMPAPVAIDAAHYREDVRLRALFASPERMRELLGRDRALVEALDAGASRVAPLTALLVTQMTEKHVLGIDMEDEILKRDVRQTVVSFDAHRLVDPCADEESTRRALKRRAYDHVLAQVLGEMGKRHASRRDLVVQRQLLARKQAALEKAGWTFGSGTASDAGADMASIERELAEVEQQLVALGPDEATLEAHLDLLCAALSEPSKWLWLEQRRIILDHRNVMRETADSVAREVDLALLHDAQGARIAMLLVGIDPAALPRTDFFQAASRYLR